MSNAMVLFPNAEVFPQGAFRDDEATEARVGWFEKDGSHRQKELQTPHAVILCVSLFHFGQFRDGLSAPVRVGPAVFASRRERGDRRESCPGNLIVEDDVDALDALTYLLQQRGYSVVRAGNGQEALEQLKAAEIVRLIVLDLAMPVMNGWEFLRHRADDPHISRIPVIVLSAVFSALPSGAEAFIRKPVQFDKLMEIIERYRGEF